MTTAKTIGKAIIEGIKDATTEQVVGGYVDPMDSFCEAVNAAQGIGDVRLYRQAGVMREPLEQMPATDFDPFTVGKKWGGGRFTAQFVQGSKIMKSVTFTARGEAVQISQPSHAAPPATAQPASDDRLSLELLRGMMAQQTALIQTLAARPRDEGSSLMEKVLPILLTRDTPVALYKQVLEMAERHASGEPPASEPTSILDVLREVGKALPHLVGTMKAQAAPAAAAAAQGAPAKIEIAPGRDAPGPTPEVISELESKTGLPLSVVPEAIRFAVRQGLPAALCADIIGAKINAKGDEAADQFWGAIEQADASAIVTGAGHLWPDLAEHEAYIREVWAELLTLAKGENEADGAAAEQPAAEAPAAAPAQPTEAPKTTTWIGNEIYNRRVDDDQGTVPTCVVCGGGLGAKPSESLVLYSPKDRTKGWVHLECSPRKGDRDSAAAIAKKEAARKKGGRK